MGFITANGLICDDYDGQLNAVNVNNMLCYLEKFNLDSANFEFVSKRGRVCKTITKKEIYGLLYGLMWCKATLEETIENWEDVYKIANEN